jgi:hypothetical protein
VFKAGAVDELKSAMRILRVDSRRAMDCLYQPHGLDDLQREQREAIAQQKQLQLQVRTAEPGVEVIRGHEETKSADGVPTSLPSDAATDVKVQLPSLLNEIRSHTGAANDNIDVEESKQQMPPNAGRQSYPDGHTGTATGLGDDVGATTLTQDEISRLIRSTSACEDSEISVLGRKRITDVSEADIGLDLFDNESKSTSPTNVLSDAQSDSHSDMGTVADTRSDIRSDSHSDTHGSDRSQANSVNSLASTFGITASMADGVSGVTVQADVPSQTSHLHLHTRTPTPDLPACQQPSSQASAQASTFSLMQPKPSFVASAGLRPFGANVSPSPGLTPHSSTPTIIFSGPSPSPTKTSHANVNSLMSPFADVIQQRQTGAPTTLLENLSHQVVFVDNHIPDFNINPNTLHLHMHTPQLPVQADAQCHSQIYAQVVAPSLNSDGSDGMAGASFGLSNSVSTGSNIAYKVIEDEYARPMSPLTPPSSPVTPAIRRESPPPLPPACDEHVRRVASLQLPQIPLNPQARTAAHKLQTMSPPMQSPDGRPNAQFEGQNIKVRHIIPRYGSVAVGSFRAASAPPVPGSNISQQPPKAPTGAHNRVGTQVSPEDIDLKPSESKQSSSAQFVIPPNCPFSPAQLEKYLRSTQQFDPNATLGVDANPAAAASSQQTGQSPIQFPTPAIYAKGTKEPPNIQTKLPDIVQGDGAELSNLSHYRPICSDLKFPTPDSPSSASLGPLQTAGDDAQDMKRKLDFKVSAKYNSSDAESGGSSSNSKKKILSTTSGKAFSESAKHPFMKSAATSVARTGKQTSSGNSNLLSLGPSLMLGSTLLDEEADAAVLNPVYKPNSIPKPKLRRFGTADDTQQNLNSESPKGVDQAQTGGVQNTNSKTFAGDLHSSAIVNGSIIFAEPSSTCSASTHIAPVPVTVKRTDAANKVNKNCDHDK